MTRRRFYFLLILFLPALLFLLRPVDVSDLSIWTAIGRDSILQRRLLFNDIYSVLPTIQAPFPLALCLVYGAIWFVGGVTLVAAAHVVIPVVWSWIWIREAGARFTKALWVFFLAIAGTSMVYVPRPALVASVPLLISYVLIVRSTRHRRPDQKPDWHSLWWLMPIEIVWVNIHGSFLILPAMLVWAALFSRERLKLLGLAGILAVAACVNPFGWQVYEYIPLTAKISVARGFEEWAPTWNSIYPTEAMFFTACSAALLYWVVRGRRWSLLRDPYWIIWLSACLVIRNVFMPFLLFPVFAFRNRVMVVNDTNDDISDVDHPRFGNALIVAAVCLVICCLLPPARLFAGPFLSTRTHLVQVNDYLRTHPGSVFNEWVYGSDLALEQPNKFYADTRNIIFSDAAFDEYMRFMNAPASGFEAIRAHGFTYALIGANEPRALAWMNAHYPVVARDQAAVLFSIVRPVGK